MLTTRFAVRTDERARVVRLCAQLTGDADAAEDLAQETLTEAWRHADRLRDPAQQAPWLAGIARNVCRRWARRRGQELARRAFVSAGDEPAASAVEGCADDGADLEVEREREELAALLDRALALLPPATRAVLVQRLVEERSYAEIAQRLGVGEGAVAVRINRGKLALRRALADPVLAEEAAAYGLAATTGDGWQETRIWCCHCGHRRLLAQFTADRQAFTLRCPDCFPAIGLNTVHAGSAASLLGDVTSYRPALTRLMAWGNGYYRRALADGAAPCPRCQRPTLLPLRLRPPEEWAAAARAERGIHLRCPACREPFDLGSYALALWLPEGRRFWREHPRLRTVPEREVEAEGRVAVVTGFVSLTDQAEFAVVSDKETFDVLSVHGA